ncbi:MAG: acyl carrier protein phosphodiesterase [Planctomycetota bacterium]
MNFLAHLLLAESLTPNTSASPETLLGAVLPDLHRGPLPENLHPDTAAAVTQHQRIDAFTDTHPAFANSKARLTRLLQHPTAARFTAITIDIVYDHLLCLDWPIYTDAPLADYTRSVHQRLAQLNHNPSPRAAAALHRIRDTRLLELYATAQGLHTALERFSAYLSHRFARTIDLTPAIDDLRDSLTGFRDDFADFFPQLQRYAEPT